MEKHQSSINLWRSYIVGKDLMNIDSAWAKSNPGLKNPSAYCVNRNPLGEIVSFWYWDQGSQPHDGLKNVDLSAAQARQDWRPVGGNPKGQV